MGIKHIKNYLYDIIVGLITGTIIGLILGSMVLWALDYLPID